MSTRNDMDDLANALEGASLQDRTDSPLRRFFLQHPVNGYTYSNRSPQTEWRAYLVARRWKLLQCKVDGTPQQQLYHEYLAAVEEEVDYLVQQNEQVREGELQPWEYLCELFEVGEAPLTKTQAKKLLAQVHVNIYDFIVYQRAQLAGQQATLRRFPTVKELAKYSKKKKIYPLLAAKKDATLRLLLRPLSRVRA
ncbi:hypothetical protein BDZ91DRAFT_181741 [Kalaharituber pfeilii]|nr:hypothetical protein BDZ91DRAFT_181741 [Kalaharituber pfeilii]